LQDLIQGNQAQEHRTQTNQNSTNTVSAMMNFQWRTSGIVDDDDSEMIRKRAGRIATTTVDFGSFFWVGITRA
jgi:hypothetical protein